MCHLHGFLMYDVFFDELILSVLNMVHYDLLKDVIIYVYMSQNVYHIIDNFSKISKCYMSKVLHHHKYLRNIDT